MVLACWTSKIDAQVKVGIKGGLNFDDFVLKNAPDELKFDNSTGWQAGFMLRATIPAVGIGIQPELLFSVRKAGDDGNISYLEVPVNLRWGFNLIVIRPYITAGPYFRYAANFNGNFSKNHLERFDWGLGLGGGVEIWKFQLGLRYSWGMQDVSKEEFEIKNNAFSLSLGYFF